MYTVTRLDYYSVLVISEIKSSIFFSRKDGVIVRLAANIQRETVSQGMYTYPLHFFKLSAS